MRTRGTRRPRLASWIGAVLLTVVSVLASPTLEPGGAVAAAGPSTAVIDFESGLGEGDIVTSVDNGAGVRGLDVDPIGVSAVRGPAMIYDSTCGGGAPGDCAAGTDGLFAPDLGQTLIVSRDANPAEPYVSAHPAAAITVSFEEPMRVLRFTTIDLEKNDPVATLSGPAGVVATVAIASAGPRTFASGWDDVTSISFALGGSGAIDEIEIRPMSTDPDTKTCPDGEEIPVDEECCAEDEVRSPSGDCVGIPPIFVECPDGTTVAAGEPCPATEQECPNGEVIGLEATCPATVQRCPNGEVIPIDATCPAMTRDCGGGVVVLVGEACPVQTTDCGGGVVVLAGAACPVQTTDCGGGVVVLVGEACPVQTTDCGGVLVVLTSGGCPVDLRDCDGIPVLAESDCPLDIHDCGDFSVIGDNCPSEVVDCGAISVLATAGCPVELIDCGSGVFVVEGNGCPGGSELCDNGAVVRTGDDCPADVFVCENAAVVGVGDDCPVDVFVCANGVVVVEGSPCPIIETKTCPSGIVIPVSVACADRGVRGVFAYLTDNDAEGGDDVVYRLVVVNGVRTEVKGVQVTATIGKDLAFDVTEEERCEAPDSSGDEVVCKLDLGAGETWTLATKPIARSADEVQQAKIGVELAVGDETFAELQGIEPSAPAEGGSSLLNVVETDAERNRVQVVLLLAMAVLLAFILYRTHVATRDGG